MSQEMNYIVNMKRNMKEVCRELESISALEGLNPEEKEKWNQMKETADKLSTVIDNKFKVKLNVLDDVYKDFCNVPEKLRASIMNDLLPLKIFTRDNFNEVFKNNESIFVFAMMIEHGVKDEILDMNQKWFAYDKENVELSSASALEFFMNGWKEFATLLIRNKVALKKLGYSEEDCSFVQKEFET